MKAGLPQRWLLAAVIVWTSVLTNAAARGEALVADLSSHLVAITTGFVGTNVLLFGATEGEGDVVVVVRGPDRSAVVRRKGRMGGIWVNVEEMRFAGVPSFYAVASNRHPEEIASPAVLMRHQIGLDALALALRPVGAVKADADVEVFREALIRNKIREGLFAPEVRPVLFLGPRLFRTDIHFPANVPTGTYTVEVLLIQEGDVVSAQTTPLIISKIGVGADIFEFANRYAVLYGLVAIAIALMAGWAGGSLFRRA